MGNAVNSQVGRLPSIQASQVSHDLTTGPVRFLHYRLQLIRREFGVGLGELKLLPTRTDHTRQPPRHLCTLNLGAKISEAALAVPYQTAAEGAYGGEKPRPPHAAIEKGVSLLQDPREERVQIHGRGDAMSQKELRHPGIPVHVDIAESGQDESTSGIDDLHPFRDWRLSFQTYGRNSIPLDNNDRVRKRRRPRPVNQGTALDH